ncbi:MAG: hypothetical protein SCALA702_09620 [Melioribacteraceae bacterium]|nr:MAG: hypothetical protein SCALA702_09620 [Melioribacteraceae bacterium]
MKKRNRNTFNSYAISIGVHALGLVLMMFWSFDIGATETEYLTVGFGTFGNSNVPGTNKKTRKAEKKERKAPKKDVAVPKVKNSDDNSVSSSSSSRDKKDEKLTQEKFEDPFGGQGFGIQLDWGGMGIRKIYNYYIPQYPPGVNKEVDLKLRFTIFPDGTVGRIIPLIKVDSRLENTAISSLRKWKFEPLTGNKKKVDQTVTIIFPFRLR